MNSRVATAVAAALGMVAGPATASPWEFNPRLEAGYLYDDNYRLTNPGSETDVQGPMVDAELELRTLTQTGEFSFAPRVRATYFSDAQDLDSVDGYATLNWEHRGQRANTRLRGNFAHENVLTSEQPDATSGGDLGEPDFGDAGRILVDNQRTRFDLRPSVSFDVSQRRELQLEAGYTDVSFEQQINDAQVGFTAADLSAGLVTRFSERNSFTVRLRGVRYEIDDRDPNQGYGAELQWDRVSATETRSYFKLGAQRIDLDTLDSLGFATTSNETAILAGAGMSFVRGRNEWFADLSRNAGASSAGVIVTRDQLRLRWTRAITPRLSLLTGVRGTHDDALDDSPVLPFTERTYATADLGLQWRWQEEFSLRVAYDYTWQKFQGAADAAKSSGALVSVLYQPLQRRR